MGLCQNHHGYENPSIKTKTCIVLWIVGNKQSRVKCPVLMVLTIHFCGVLNIFLSIKIISAYATLAARLRLRQQLR